ncbi:PDZ domain-containing RING finger protein 4-like isoform X4 [Salvelinus fontinalis]|uniref:PDZ domain-containing RING finger protein 4-like isoform X4 n=1 Tax=Salvelinus fontinalis TaxID=8038 RepID=UPI00248695B7|nr:PDZ domain-containing RING finger protein 4-like isoform X4 [Salvelinus fontinalis]
MGCNLCTLQKREEHYKLLYEIAQVNGKDLSKASHDEAVEAFRSAKDPIVVQVLRRNTAGRGGHVGSTQEVGVVDVVDMCTQTDITFEHIMALAKLRATTPPVPDICPFLLSDSCHSLHTMEQDYYEGRADGGRTEEFEYEVGPNSIAARDGRIREGDHILQINGQDVQDREEAVAVLSSEDTRNIILLVARPEIQLEEAWLDDEHSEFLEQLKMEMLEEQQREEMELEALQEEQEQPRGTEEDDITATCSSLTQDKDSELGMSDHNALLTHIQRRLSQCLRDRQDTGHHRLEEEEEEEELEVDGDRFQQLLELKCQIRNSGEYDLFYSRHSTIECSLGEPAGGVQHELRMLNEELCSIELECQNIMQAHKLRKGPGGTQRDQVQQVSPITGRPVPKDQNFLRGSRDSPSRGKLADINKRQEKPEKSDKDSSSAYNTAESSRSTPLAMDRSPEHSLQRRMVTITNQRNLRSSLASLHATASPSPSPSPTQRSLHRAPIPGKASSPDHSPNRYESDQTAPADDERSGNGKVTPQHPPRASQIPYLSPSRSSQHRQPNTNIPAHARHYQSYMQLIQQRSAVEYAQSQLSLLSVVKEPQLIPANEPKMEWKVKIRSDGTRYITKRPIRDKILRERALKIKEERSGGMTTDDDAMSEMKMGRYWSKEERKQHLVRAKEQRRRREFMQQSRLESLRESPQSSSEGRKEVSIIELSHRKMMKKRNKKILDNWMTIQELMTHGAKAPDDPRAKVHNAFLSVTTV